MMPGARLPEKLAGLGCATLLLGIVALIAVKAGRAFPVIIGVAIAVAVFVEVGRRLYRRLTALRFLRAHRGRDLLIVYTDSPHWKEHIETKWLARWPDRTVAFNRSRPWSGRQPEAALWRIVAGIAEHTPLAVLVLPGGKVRVIRFFQAFRDFKHGKEGKLRAAEHELEIALSGRGTGASRPG